MSTCIFCFNPGKGCTYGAAHEAHEFVGSAEKPVKPIVEGRQAALHQVRATVRAT